MVESETSDLKRLQHYKAHEQDQLDSFVDDLNVRSFAISGSLGGDFSIGSSADHQQSDHLNSSAMDFSFSGGPLLHSMATRSTPSGNGMANGGISPGNEDAGSKCSELEQSSPTNTGLFNNHGFGTVQVTMSSSSSPPLPSTACATTATGLSLNSSLPTSPMDTGNIRRKRGRPPKRPDEEVRRQTFDSF